jgi:hypothetical protein
MKAHLVPKRLALELWRQHRAVKAHAGTMEVQRLILKPWMLTLELRRLALET